MNHPFSPRFESALGIHGLVKRCRRLNQSHCLGCCSLRRKLPSRHWRRLI
ncbi:MAG: DUF4033 domain-containing protein [Zhongshania sp.]|nr:DUF4033 domain-containing protein [Zhongshania sp.]